MLVNRVTMLVHMRSVLGNCVLVVFWMGVLGKLAEAEELLWWLTN